MEYGVGRGDGLGGAEGTIYVLGSELVSADFVEAPDGCLLIAPIRHHRRSWATGKCLIRLRMISLTDKIYPVKIDPPRTI